jgi:hypothetical protein
MSRNKIRGFLQLNAKSLKKVTLITAQTVDEAQVKLAELPLADA